MTAPSTSPTRPLDTDGPAGAGPRGAGLDAGLLLLRIAVGAIMAAHGAQKLFGWFGGGGIEGTAQFFTSVGYPAGEAMATVAALTETFGGLALILGLLTPLAAAAVTGTMINALAVKWNGGFFSPDGVEYELLLVAASAALALTGPGRLAADRALPPLRGHRTTHGVGALALAVITAGVVLLLRG
ncbi:MULTISPECIES: DoxX family protein [Streptomyces]|uniref:DoxX family protein n=1 Tax=Streptomyces TaxID=1883 RepID=UPI0001CE7DB2|nr:MULTISPECIES: DoxX family protein [Streptomyces albidoflavus group]AGI86771.1 DoxX family protein [Streptomyces albidoflavus]EFE85112.1 DoxX family protein [Streptomyces albidoflavus]QLP90542.1 DoxX family protein [Streptomyces albidoflavus]RZE69296.1 DoxX family protein [Streptomyces albidoflavus]RZE85234.1 DoxX family protein [Streptomyces albidoflavus]